MKPKVSIEEFSAKLDKVSDIDFARLAAFIDGEGCIVISGSPPRGGAKASRMHSLVLTVTNTNLLLFDWIIDTFGGNVVFANRNHLKNAHTKPCYRRMINENQSEEILRRCLPYFIMKLEQAKIGLAFRDLKRRKFGASHNSRVTPAQVRARDALQQKISALNSVKGFGLVKAAG